ncbi:transglutaminase family protein [Parasphingopyxis sp.]|uniref:transglutaminase-like domain-containing protein n=1 Tax=Parasphingopyxis sp. TaxID=1920299 RepID=UPI0026226EA0|nr:transglutaminase family protein [Parasphingopyxis sp.]
MHLSIHTLLDYRIDAEADILLQIEAAANEPTQRVIEGRMTVATGSELHPVPVDAGLGRRTWTRGSGPFRVEYRATVDVERTVQDIAGLGVTPYADLPGEAVPYIWPSRYCQSDRFASFVAKQFGDLEGGAKILAMADWVHDQLDYVIGASDGDTGAADTFISREGICRDYAHLLISFARAAGIPARMVSAYAWNLEPQDFHAVAEIWLEDGWHMIDATRMAPIEGLVPIITGRDATDIAFMTIFGRADLQNQMVNVERLD